MVSDGKVRVTDTFLKTNFTISNTEDFTNTEIVASSGTSNP